MATITKSQLRVVGMLGSLPVPCGEQGEEESSQSYTRGGPLQADATTGELEVWAGDNQALVGFAHAAASGTAGTAVTYTPAVLGLLVEANLLEAAAADHTSDADDLHKKYALQVSGGNTYINHDETGATKVCVYVYRFAQGSVAGDVNARVIGAIISSAWVHGLTA